MASLAAFVAAGLRCESSCALVQAEKERRSAIEEKPISFFIRMRMHYNLHLGQGASATGFNRPNRMAQKLFDQLRNRTIMLGLLEDHSPPSLKREGTGHASKFFPALDDIGRNER